MCKDLFETIDTTIRKERLYAEVGLMREDVMKRFRISRHHLNGGGVGWKGMDCWRCVLWLEAAPITKTWSRRRSCAAGQQHS